MNVFKIKQDSEEYARFFNFHQQHRTMQDREVNALNNSSEMEESTRDSEQHLLSDVESRSDSDSDDYQKTVHSSLV